MNVKPSDLAIQIKSVTDNAGKIVKVLSFLGEAPVYDGAVWNIADGVCWLVEYTSLSKSVRSFGGDEVRYSRISPVPDAWLRPISGLPDADKLEDEKPIKEVA